MTARRSRRARGTAAVRASRSDSRDRLESAEPRDSPPLVAGRQRHVSRASTPRADRALPAARAIARRRDRTFRRTRARARAHNSPVCAEAPDDEQVELRADAMRRSRRSSAVSAAPRGEWSSTTTNGSARRSATREAGARSSNAQATMPAQRRGCDRRFARRCPGRGAASRAAPR